MGLSMSNTRTYMQELAKYIIIIFGVNRSITTKTKVTKVL